MKMFLTILLAAAFRMTVIPVQFEDLGMSSSSAQVADLAARMESYFNTQFGGSTVFTITAAPTVTLSHPMEYYGANYSDRRDVLLHEAVREACSKSGQIDFKNLDGDSDSYVDNVFLITAGGSEADGAGENCIWPQQGYLKDNGGVMSLQGVKIDSFAAVPENSGFGVFCHELAHALGLYDMYDTDGESSGGETRGLWETGLMDYGCKADPSKAPYFSALDMEMLGIGNAKQLATGSYTLSPIDENHTYLKAGSPTDGEYYLFECRKAEGLLVYHVDRSTNAAGYSDYWKVELNAYERWVKNQINCRPDHPCAMIVTADPEATDQNQIFFPQKDHSSFGSGTTPGFTFWDGTGSTFALTNIKILPDGSVSFNVVEPLKIDAVTAWQDAALLSWTASNNLENITGYTISWTDGESEFSAEAGQDASGFMIEGLDPLAEYSFTISVKAGGGKEIYQVGGSFTTKAYRSGTYPFIYLSATTRNTDGSFPAGAKLPLRIFNATDVDRVEWYFNKSRIAAGSDGYYHIQSSGEIRAVIFHTDGGSETIIKEVKVK